MEDNEANRPGLQRSRQNTLGRSEYMKFCWIMSLWIDRVFPWGRRENGSAHYWNALESAPWKLSIRLIHMLTKNRCFPFLPTFPYILSQNPILSGTWIRTLRALPDSGQTLQISFLQ